MLDNFSPEQLKETAATLKAQFPHLLIEASGGITSETLPQYVSPHVDIVSQGKLTQGTPSHPHLALTQAQPFDKLCPLLVGYGFVDFSLKIQKAEGVIAPQ